MSYTGEVVSGSWIQGLALWCFLLQTVKRGWSFPGTPILVVVLIYGFKNMPSLNHIHYLGILFEVVFH